MQQKCVNSSALGSQDTFLSTLPKDFTSQGKQVLLLFMFYLRRHVVCDAELQMCEDALHAVEGLLPGGPQVFLHGPRHRGEDSLSRLPRVHHLPRVFGG